jgi:hypothetical protein
MVGLEVGRPKRLIDVVGERGISKLDERGNGEALADEGNASRKLNKTASCTACRYGGHD